MPHRSPVSASLTLLLIACAVTLVLAPAMAQPPAGAVTGEEEETPPAGVDDPPTGDLEGAGIDDEDALRFKINAEYRLRSLHIDPFDLSGEDVRDVRWTEQRLRLDLGVEYEKIGRIVIQLDALDGVLLGDNGRYGGTPSTNYGVSVASRIPNMTRWTVGLRDEGDPLSPDSYIPVLEAVNPIEINYAYGEVVLPVGLLRIGRQPMIDGSAIAAHDGGRYNRWGVSRFSDATDRILFGTKLDEAVRVISGGGGPPDLRIDRGVFFALLFGWSQQNAIAWGADDVYQAGAALQWRKPEADWGGLAWRDIFASIVLYSFHNERYETGIYSLPTALRGSIENVTISLLTASVFGQSREISEGFAELSGQAAQTQDLLAFGAQAIVDVAFGPLTATLEFDYASGDADPRPDTPITTQSFARDLNVGLFLFEHLLAFESARSVAVGIENLSQAETDSFPITEASTEGRFTNAIAFFPQVTLDWIDTPRHHLHTRLGVLMAWPASPDGVVDPIMTILRADGDEISDDAVNYHGGDPGSYYGTEVDLQVQWAFASHFVWTVEGAVLFPGSSLQDENGDAVTGYMVENRFEYLF